jgi:F-type H+-transporting ATPase subunit epsilon
MRLRIITPLRIVVDEPDVIAVRAEDGSGSFGILPGHADFLTSLAISAVRWKARDGAVHFCAVRRGVMTVTGGQDIAIVTREAIPGEDLATLDAAVLARFHADHDAERSARVGSTRLQLAAIRHMITHLRPSS